MVKVLLSKKEIMSMSKCSVPEKLISTLKVFFLKMGWSQIQSPGNPIFGHRWSGCQTSHVVGNLGVTFDSSLIFH